MTDPQPEAPAIPAIPAIPGVTQWRRKTVEVEAIQFTGKNHDAVYAFIGNGFVMPGHDGGISILMASGWRWIKPGCWVGREDGALGAWDEATFAHNFVPVSAPVAPPAGTASGDRGRDSATADDGSRERSGVVLGEAAVERVRALAQSWASLPPEGDPRREHAADIDRHAGTVILGMLDSASAADVALSRVSAVAESWLTPGSLSLFYPAAGQAVLDAIRGGSTEEEARWRERAVAAEGKLTAIGEVCDRPFPGTAAEARWAADILAILGSEGDARPWTAADERTRIFAIADCLKSAVEVTSQGCDGTKATLVEMVPYLALKSMVIHGTGPGGPVGSEEESRD